MLRKKCDIDYFKRFIKISTRLLQRYELAYCNIVPIELIWIKKPRKLIISN